MKPNYLEIKFICGTTFDRDGNLVEPSVCEVARRYAQDLLLSTFGGFSQLTVTGAWRSPDSGRHAGFLQILNKQNKQMKEYTTYEQIKPEPKFRRVPVIPELQRVRAAEELANPHFKATRGARKALHHLRSYVLSPEVPQEPKAFPVKFALKLTTLRLTQLIRQQKKWAREASTAKHLLAKMTPGYSRLRTAMTQRQDDCLARLGQVTAEIRARALACEGRLAYFGDDCV